MRLPSARRARHRGAASIRSTDSTSVRSAGRSPWSHAPTFDRPRGARSRRAGRVVDDELHRAEGLIDVVGIGEAPIGRLATFSLWESLAAARTFAHSMPDHVDVVRRTRADGWYSEELFARFEPYASTGRWNARDPLDTPLIPEIDRVRCAYRNELDQFRELSGYSRQRNDQAAARAADRRVRLLRCRCGSRRAPRSASDRRRGVDGGWPSPRRWPRR